MSTFTIPQLQARFQQIVAQYRSGQISREQAEGMIMQLRAQDERGVWWSIQPQTGQLLYYNGQQWIPGLPPGITAPSAPPHYLPQQPARPIPRTDAPVAGSSLAQRWLRFAATPILALLPGAFCGGTWFLYTLVGIFKNEGISGVDWLTPIILVGMPPLLWAVSRPLDRLLLPFQGLRNAIPMPMRYGGALALPLVLSCLLSTISKEGYGALHLASIISILTSYVIFRNPEVRS